MAKAKMTITRAVDLAENENKFWRNSFVDEALLIEAQATIKELEDKIELLESADI